MIRYHISSVDRNTLEAWSDVRLPYQATEFRNSLQKALRGLCPSPHVYLYSSYISESKERFDVENILYYNVGTAIFKESKCKSIYFERVIDKPPDCNAVGNWLHYVKYTFTDERAFEHWKPGKSLIKWEELDFLKLNTSPRPELIWYKFRSGIDEEKVKMVQNVSISEKKLGLKVTIHAPENTALNLTSVVKPLFDGLMASFSSHEGDLDLAVKRLASRLKIDEQALYYRLRYSKMPILGTKKLLGVHGKGIQWYPNDDLLVAGAVDIKYNNPVNTWKLSGELFTVER